MEVHLSTDATFEMQGRTGGLSAFVRVDRTTYYFLVCGLVLGNALYSPIIYYISHGDIITALLNTFGISAIAWFGLWAAMSLLATKTNDRPTALDYAVGAASLLVAFLPIGSATWVFITALAPYLILTSRVRSPIYRAAWIMMTLTVPLFWGRRIMQLFADYILAGDAMLVSAITNTARRGNLVDMPGSDGILAIYAPCSSFANVSLALLCWTVMTQIRRVEWRPVHVFWCLAACLTMVAVNVSRISLIGFFPQHYHFLHEGYGSALFSWASMLACYAVCNRGTLRAP
jgi:exosortase/archaeosortase family protein